MSSGLRTLQTDGADPGRLDVVVAAIDASAEPVRIYEFRRRDGGPLPPAEPGGHIDVFLAGGYVRQYSLLGSGPAPDAYHIAVKRQDDGRGGSRTLHETLSVGAALRIGRPRNNFPLDETAANTVLIGGGIGVTPLWSMAARLSALGRPWTLHYFCRTPGELIAPEAMRGPDPRVLTRFTSLAPRRETDIAAIVADAPADSHLYCCGPLPMLKAFQAATDHLPDARVHVEYFASDIVLATEGGFLVELVRSGLTLRVGPGQTIVEVVTGAGVKVLSQCTQGYCGTCETRVLGGAPDHRDVVLTRAEKAASRTMMICCSRSHSERLILDL
jgi:ferredoxin-NADP reductase